MATTKKLKYGWQGEREEYVYPPVKRYDHLNYLPDTMIQKVLRLLPTAPAVRMSLLSKQWQDQWSTAHILDFDEFDHPSHNHLGFIIFVETCLMKFSETGNLLDKFRLRMKPVESRFSDDVHRLLNIALKSRVKELDISVSQVSDLNQYILISNINKSHSSQLFHSNSITSLKLEGVKIFINGIRDTVLLPSLKCMSLRTVYYSKHLSNFIKRCPSLEFLSLSSYSLHEHFFFEPFEISSSSLKELEVKNSRGTIQVEASHLESLKFVSEYYSLVMLKACHSLKYVNIQAPYLIHLELLGCEDNVKGAIDTQNLLSLHLRGYGWINSKVSMKAPNLSEVVVDLRDKDPTVKWSQLEDSTTLKAFSDQIGCSKEITGADVDEAYILSEKFKKNHCPAFQDDKKLQVLVINSAE